MQITDLVPDIDRRFGALARLFGNDGAARIRSAHIVIVGIGGVGSWAAEAAARSGVARITLVDLDHVAESNINRQVHAVTPTIGQSKVLAMGNRIALIHPGCVVDCIEDFVDAENWPALLAGIVAKDFSTSSLSVLDACDNIPAKSAMASWSLENNATKFISVGAAGGKRLAHLVDVVDLAKVTHDPLLARLRSNLRKFHKAPRNGKKMDVMCVFSKEEVFNFNLNSFPETNVSLPSDHSLNCHGYGSTVSVTATFGFSAMGWLLDRIASSSN